MTNDDTQEGRKEGPKISLADSAARPRDWRDVFTLPRPVKEVFQRFPLVTYPANRLPQRAPQQRAKHVLHVFTTPEEALIGAPSFNPTCLKWQLYLKSCGIDFHIVASSNHASPSGILPFLIPNQHMDADLVAPIPSNKIQRWAKDNGSAIPETNALRAEAYTALLDHRIRRAWLYLLYLDEENFQAVAKHLYVEAASSNVFVNSVTSYNLRKAAMTELQKTNVIFSADDIMADAKEALSALSVLLGSSDYFFGARKVELFDASVFAYTHLLLDERMGWRVNELAEELRSLDNLVAHQSRILQQYF